MNVQQFRAVTYLKNTGESREMLRVVQTKREKPARRIFRMLAELGVPCSMTEELVGHRLDEWDEAAPVHSQRLQALWALAEGYMDVVRRSPGSLEALSDVVLEAQQWGVWYEPPSAAWAVIERKRFLALPEHEKTVRALLNLPEVVNHFDLPREHTEASCLLSKTYRPDNFPRSFPKGADMLRVVRLYAAGMRAWRMASVINRAHATVDSWFRAGVMDAALAHIRTTRPEALRNLPDPKTGVETPDPFETVEGAGRLAPPKNGGRGPRKGYKYP
jgi:hypothetical protein